MISKEKEQELTAVLEQFYKEVEIKAKETGHPEFAEQFKRSYGDTLKRTMAENPDGTVHVITGDIPAMWLRDSTAQVRPYLYLAARSTKLQELIGGVVQRQFFYLLMDPYANAFNNEPSGACWAKDFDDQNPWVWERKFEIDSLCYPIQLAWLLWKNTGYTAHLDENFRKGVQKILEVFHREQNHEERSEYRFVRNGSFYTDTLSREGKGALTRPDIGLIWSGFRPSDDACTYGYLIPSNMFAVVVLGYLSELAQEVLNDRKLAESAQNLRKEIHKAIEKYGHTKTEEFGEVYAYETDGYGMYHLMDDANVPSLLSIKYLGYPTDRELAENTRNMILSEANPYYYKGKAASGIGSPHTPANYIWHIGMAMEGLTSDRRTVKESVLEKMIETTGSTGLMHEGFHADDPSRYTREWFSWANAMYCELLLDYLGYKIIS